MSGSDRVEQPGGHVSPRWAQWRAALPVDEYERRFAAMEADGAAVHGEADFLDTLAGPAATILDAGCGTGRVAVELARRGHDVVGVDLDDDMLAPARTKAPHLEWACADLATFDLGRRFDVVALPGNVLLFCQPEARPAIVERCSAHVGPGGYLVHGFSLERRRDAMTAEALDEYAERAGLELVARYAGWDREPFEPGVSEYQLSVHRRPG
ncbi:MAG: class I SAM-dependent methyltransferase [Ilumatobacteraceae bacterium]